MVGQSKQNLGNGTAGGWLTPETRGKIMKPNEVDIVLDQESESIPVLQKAVADGKIITAQLDTVTALPRGIEGGKTSVAFVGEMADGQVVYMQTTLRVFQTAAAGFLGRYGDESDGALLLASGKDVVVGWPGS